MSFSHITSNNNALSPYLQQKHNTICLSHLLFISPHRCLMGPGSLGTQASLRWMSHLPPLIPTPSPPQIRTLTLLYQPPSPPSHLPLPPSTPSLSLYAYLCSNLHLKSEGHVISPPINTHHHRSLSPAQEKFSDFPLLSLYLPLSSPFSLHEFSLSQFDHLLLPISE